MGFLNPWLLAGLAGVAVPILIHLLNRFRQRRIDWAAMELLRRAIVIRQRRIRIEDLILLALRCLAVVLVALAMSRPTLSTAGAKWFGAQEQVGAVIALDGSFSMAFRPGVGSRFDRAIETVKDLKAALDPGDPTSLVLMGNRPRIALRATGYDDRRLEKALKEMQPLPEPLNLEQCLDQLLPLVRETRAPVRECYIVTDAQAATWGNLSEKARRALRDIGQEARIFVLPLAPDSGENTALAGLALQSGSLRRGTLARLAAEVRNFGRLTQDRVVVSLLAGEKPVDQRVVERLAPGGAQTVPLFVRLDEPGSLRLTATIGHDALDTDNVRHAVARVRDQVRVLVVDGDPSDRPYRGETDYLATALLPKPPPGGKPSMAVEAVPWVELPSKNPDTYDVVILANLPDIRQAQVDELFGFVQEGGGLAVFLGDKVNPVLLNPRMRQGDAALLPGEVGEAAAAPGDAPEGAPLAAADAQHPLARALEVLPPALMAEARVQRYFKVALGTQGRAVLKVAGADTPLLAEKSIGRGKVLLFASTADRAWTNLPTHPAFPVLLQEIVTYLTTRSHERPWVVGEPLVVALPTRSTVTSVVFRGPGGAETAVQVLQRDGRRVAAYEHTDQPGFYEMAQPGGPPAAAAVNVDARESDVRTLVGESLAAALSGLPVQILGPDVLNKAGAIRETRVGRELWRILMLAAIAVLALEGFLAWRFARQMQAAESSPTPTGRQVLDERSAA
ncbi:MAG: VWA domain-containing protein [Planctomycetes bacterium]|nr:VWA domain-containing protein [Planctomycetota bacterium]